jgi:hypothetical protein
MVPIGFVELIFHYFQGFYYWNKKMQLVPGRNQKVKYRSMKEF